MIKPLNPRDIKYGIVHCSASPHGLNTRASDINQWHINRRDPFDCIGYHEVILENGATEHGRPHYIRGAHCKNFNWCSLSVCLIGNDYISFDQKIALRQMLIEWLRVYPSMDIRGHTELDARKTCPNFNVQNFLREFEILK